MFGFEEFQKNSFEQVSVFFFFYVFILFLFVKGLSQNTGLKS